MTASIKTPRANKTAATKGASKPAAKTKGSKPEVSKTPAQQETPAAPAETYAQALARVLTERAAAAPSKDLDLARNTALKGQGAINTLHADPAFGETLDALLKNAAVSEKSKPGFVGVKPMVKIVNAMIAIASGVKSEFDPYSRTIIANLSALSGVTNKSALVCLSKSVEYDALDQQQALSATYNCNPSTASTQASSTRMMLRELGLCAVVKGKQGDVTQTLDNARCARLLALFAPAE